MIEPAKPFVFDESANSPDLSDEEVSGAIPTARAEDIVPHLADQKCRDCGKTLAVTFHEKRFRYPHFYWRSGLRCPDEHTEERVFQVTWLYEGTHLIPR
jgi:hypothetical protein